MFPRTVIKLPRIATMFPRTVIKLPRIATMFPRTVMKLPRIATMFHRTVTKLPGIATNFPGIVTKLKVNLFFSANSYFSSINLSSYSEIATLAPARLHRMVSSLRGRLPVSLFLRFMIALRLRSALPIMPERKEFWMVSLLFGRVEYHAMQSRGSEGTILSCA